MRALIVLALVAGFAHADEFEVASLKPSQDDSANALFRPSPGGLTMVNVPLRHLMLFAFKAKEYQLVGAPAWTAERFDVTARTSAPTSMDTTLLMLRHLLEGRCKLQVHTEQRPHAEYVLLPPKAGAMVNSSSAAACIATPVAPCGTVSVSGAGMQGQRVPMQVLIFFLSQSLQSNVVDESGLKGAYDVALNWPVDGDDLPDTIASRVVAAVRSQLGLNIERRKGMIDVVVVDHIEKPAAN